MHTTGIRPASSATWVFFATVSSVSPYSERRSEWPTSTHLTPRSVSMPDETSPV